MAKKSAKSKELVEDDNDNIFSELASITGGDVVSDLESVKFRIDTGNLALNYSCAGKCIGGGIPGGRITEAYGPEASGKSLIGSNVLGAIQKAGGWAIILDCENSINPEFMKKISRVNTDKVLRYAPPSLERAFRQIHVVTKAIREREKAKKLERKPILVVFDSITVPPCERELRENNLPMDYNPADWKKLVGNKEQPGERAKIISSEMRKLQSMSVENEVTVYLINQVRDKIGVLYGNPETTPGGNAVKFYSSLRIRTQSKKKIEHKKLKSFSGINIQVKNVKNRGFKPFVVADDIKLFFENGIDPISGLLKILLEAGRVEAKSAGNFVVKQEFLGEGFEEYKFKASQVENRIPLQLILDNPKLVDVETTQEVQDYVDWWSSGMNATDSGEYSEMSLSEDDDDDDENSLYGSVDKESLEEDEEE